MVTVTIDRGALELEHGVMNRLQPSYSFGLDHDGMQCRNGDSRAADAPLDVVEATKGSFRE